MTQFTRYLEADDSEFENVVGIKHNITNWYITETNNTYSDKFVTIKKLDSRAHVKLRCNIVDEGFNVIGVESVTVKKGQTKEIVIGISVSFDEKLLAMRAVAPTNNWHNLDINEKIVVNKYNSNKISVVVTNNTDADVTIDYGSILARIVFDEL